MENTKVVLIFSQPSFTTTSTGVTFELTFSSNL